MKSKTLFGKGGIFGLTVIVSALGYFVDVYDIVLFGIVRTPSLQAIGITGDSLFSNGVLLINTQMAGMLVGGPLWGIMGDRRGRLSVLFGSILLYSLANIANAFVTNMEQYILLRFLAGVGLAGEIGGAITLVSETMDKNRRGYGATVIASIGFLGGVAAGLVANMFDWRTAYIVGGVLGLLLLFLRMKLFESGMFESIKENKNISRGNFLMLLWPPRRMMTYLCCIAVGIPIYYVVLVFAYFTPELAKYLGASGEVLSSTSLMMLYAGLPLGGITCGVLSEKIKSRRKTFLVFLALSVIGALTYLYSPPGMPPAHFYALTAFLGFASGYCTLFFIISAEQFGTNIRATASTSIANFVRASTIPITSAYAALKMNMGYLESALLIGGVCFVLAGAALFFLQETYGKDLDYTE